MKPLLLPDGQVEYTRGTGTAFTLAYAGGAGHFDGLRAFLDLSEQGASLRAREKYYSSDLSYRFRMVGLGVGTAIPLVKGRFRMNLPVGILYRAVLRTHEQGRVYREGPISVTDSTGAEVTVMNGTWTYPDGVNADATYRHHFGIIVGLEGLIAFNDRFDLSVMGRYDQLLTRMLVDDPLRDTQLSAVALQLGLWYRLES